MKKEHKTMEEKDPIIASGMKVVEESWEKNIRERFQTFSDDILWSNDDGSEKYIGVGNMADWWIKEIKQLLQKEREDIVGEIEQNFGQIDYNGPFYKIKSGKFEDIASIEDIINIIKNK